MQSSFKVTKKDETRKWDKLKALLIKLDKGFEKAKKSPDVHKCEKCGKVIAKLGSNEDAFINQIDNGQLVKKILKRMEKLESQEKAQK